MTSKVYICKLCSSFESMQFNTLTNSQLMRTIRSSPDFNPWISQSNKHWDISPIVKSPGRENPTNVQSLNNSHTRQDSKIWKRISNWPTSWNILEVRKCQDKIINLIIKVRGISLQTLKSTDRCKQWSVYAQRHILVQQAHFILGRNLASRFIFLVERAVIILFWSFSRDIFQRNNAHKCVLIYSCPVKN